MTGYIDPDRESFRTFSQLPIEGPVEMLNLLKLRDHAAYEDGRPASGLEAYKAYSDASEPFFRGVGGTIIWRGKPRFGVIGPSHETWDLGFIARYPSHSHFLAMVKDKGYQAIVFHRQAAVADSRLYCFEAAEAGGLFG